MPEPAIPHSGLPPQQVGPYQILEQLGEGGMGVVFLAFDSELGRRVALKWLKHGTADTIDRIRQEAQLHARVEHPAVCRLYHVGEHQGLPYLVMQLVKGQTLDRVAKALSLETKLRLMATLADGVHAAHRQGLIHRDIKPSNLMVEADEAGGWRPYVMDFGLARDEASGTLTGAGMILGSPAYMAPEQITGGWVDPRTDVYGLGASLFEVLTGRPPFLGSHPTDLLVKAQTEEAPRLRSLAPGLPKDLETILQVCLAKDPARRYPSAAAFRDDLLRVLDGDPIQARQLSLAERVSLWTRRNPRLAAVSAVGAFGMVLTGALWIRAEWRSGERARFARELGEQVAAMESTSRVSALLPLHDTRREANEIRGRMASIQRDMGRLGSLGAGPAHYALGRGYLALGDEKQAREELERAWEAGARNPETAAALGRALGRLYKAALVGAAGLGSKDLREEETKRLERTLRDPALRFLKEGKAARSESPVVMEGLIALYEKRYDQAKELAAQATRNGPWPYEGLRLEAEAWTAQAEEEKNRGQWEAALEDLRQAGIALSRAMEEARSDVGLREVEGERRMAILGIGVARGSFDEAQFQWAVAGGEDILRANPESGIAYGIKAGAYWHLGASHMAGGLDPRPALDQAIEAAQAGLRFHPGKAGLNNSEGICWSRKAQYEKSRGLDPAASAKRGMDAFSRTLEADPGYFWVLNNAGNLARLVAEFELGQGKDPRASLDQAVGFFTRATALNPRYANAFNGLGTAWYVRSSYEGSHGLDPSASLRSAIAGYDAALAINPKMAFAHNNLGEAYNALAKFHDAAGQPWEGELDRAFAEWRASLALSPANLDPMYNLAAAQRRKAAAAFEARGADPSPLLAEARTGIRKALKIKPDDADCLQESAQVSLLEGRWAMRQKQPPEAFLAAAESDLRKALGANPREPAVHAGLGDLWIARADAHEAAGRPFRADLQRAGEALDAALAINGADSGILAKKGRQLLRLAESEPDSRRSKGLAGQALQALEAALKQDARQEKSLREPLERARRISAEGTAKPRSRAA